MHSSSHAVLGSSESGGLLRAPASVLNRIRALGAVQAPCEHPPKASEMESLDPFQASGVDTSASSRGREARRGSSSLAGSEAVPDSSEDPEGDDDDHEGHGGHHSDPETRLDLGLGPLLGDRQRTHQEELKMPELDRRQGRVAGKRDVAHCVACERRYDVATMRLQGKLCANCFKTYESVSRTVGACDGSFRLVVRRVGLVEMELRCHEGHRWSLPFSSRRAKNWCRQCKDEVREHSEREQEERVRRAREELLRAQEELFSRSSEPVPDDPGDSSSEPERDPELDRLHELLVV